MDSDPDRLQLSGDEMRRLGHAMVETLAAHFEGLAEGPVGRRAPREELERLLREPIPEDGRDPLGIVERVTLDFLGAYLKGKPRALARMAAAGNIAGTAHLQADR